MATLERAIELAAKAHAGQVDKAGQPYILHPLRLMLAVRTPHERMDLSRIASPTEKDYARLREYEQVRAILLAAGATNP